MHGLDPPDQFLFNFDLGVVGDDPTVLPTRGLELQPLLALGTHEDDLKCPPGEDVGHDTLVAIGLEGGLGLGDQEGRIRLEFEGTDKGPRGPPVLDETLQDLWGLGEGEGETGVPSTLNLVVGQVGGGDDKVRHGGR